MSLKSFLTLPIAQLWYKKIVNNKFKAIENQEKIFRFLCLQAQHTDWGKTHYFKDIQTQEHFAQAMPVSDYESIRPYIEKIKDGKENVLWKGKPLYFAKTSGTTSGIKYIPITKESISNHINGARNALICYLANTKKTNILNGKMIFLSGSPELETSYTIPTGRLSGIVNHHIPSYLKKNQLPSYKTNCIASWEDKLEAIISETLLQDMTLISGIPPWVQMYFEKILEKTKKQSIKEIFPNFRLFIHGGVNFKPYKPIFANYIGQDIDNIETYPASEGFIAYQEYQNEEGLLLNTNDGIYYQFIEASQFDNPSAKKKSLKDVELNVNYVLLISSNAGLWSYNIGDTIKFVSLNPYKLIVTGRIKHFISAFGEHVIAEEVEFVLNQTIQEFNFQIKEFTVAPNISANGNAHHEWLIEFETMPSSISNIEKSLNDNLCKKNIYYKDLIQGNILQTLKITPIRKNGFIEYMKQIGKLGEQNKVPRLSNDRVLADALSFFKQ